MITSSQPAIQAPLFPVIIAQSFSGHKTPPGEIGENYSFLFTFWIGVRPGGGTVRGVHSLQVYFPILLTIYFFVTIALQNIVRNAIIPLSIGSNIPGKCGCPDRWLFQAVIPQFPLITDDEVNSDTFHIFNDFVIHYPPLIPVSLP